MNGWNNEWMDGIMDGWNNGWTDGWMKGGSVYYLLVKKINE